MNKYKVVLTLQEVYEVYVNANSAEEAHNIASDMDIAEFTETGITTQDMSVFNANE